MAYTLQYYLYSLWSLFFAYWTHRPVHTFAVLVSLHLLYSCIVDTDASAADVYAVNLWRPLALVLGCTTGGLMAYVLRAPRPLKLFSYPWWYSLSVATLGALFVGTGLAWQLAPQEWWNYFFVVTGVQALLLIASYILLPHDRVWQSTRGSGFRVHFHFAVICLVALDLPFAIGQTARGTSGLWPFYYALIAFCASISYALVHNFVTYDSPPRQVSTVAFRVPPEQPHERDYL